MNKARCRKIRRKLLPASWGRAPKSLKVEFIIKMQTGY